jgi:VRR-NUC domain
MPPSVAMSERELLSVVLETARIFGWRTAHFRPAQTQHGWRTAVGGDGAGFPDLVLVRDRVLFVELKVGRNTLREEQAAWARALESAGAEFHVWTEHDWISGVIETRLRRS